MIHKLLVFFAFIDRVFARTVKFVLISVLLGMIFLVVTQVILRNIFNSGIPWADVAARHMVLWIAFLGAMLATRSREHISIGALLRVFPRKSRNAVRIGLDALACSVSFILAKASFAFVLDEKAMGIELFMGIPTWIAEVIIPFGFAMISIEYAIGVFWDIWRIITEGNDTVEAGRGPR